ncbi:MAG: polysaccharide biosynthesis/export family protein [Bacteroidales bacterium]|nr:polysaccharide biosynthesis/export family protein [Bacteroidales bacterium]
MKTLRYCAILSICAIMASCSSHRAPLTYFEDIDTMQAAIPTGDYKVKIQPSDELMITVTSEVPSATADYNLPLYNPGKSSDMQLSTQPKQQTYIVDSKGDINFPILGLIHVAGMDVEQLREYLTQRISENVLDPVVNVQLVNFVVNVAGEVKTPGRVSVTGTRYSLLDALTAAGDLTPYGMRENVLIIREQDGKRTHARINLNDAATLESPYFYLKQNDYIYVEPTPVRKDNADYNTNDSYKLSIVSTIVSACSVITSLVIALCIK